MSMLRKMMTQMMQSQISFQQEMQHKFEQQQHQFYKI